MTLLDVARAFCVLLLPTIGDLINYAMFPSCFTVKMVGADVAGRAVTL